MLLQFVIKERKEDIETKKRKLLKPFSTCLTLAPTILLT